MKRTAIFLTLLGAAAAFAQPARPPANCSLATLRGDYLFAQDGVHLHGGDQIPMAASGHDVFDGAGKFRGMLTVADNGRITRRTYSGTYTLKSDCSGTLTMTDNLKKTSHYDFYTVPGGEELVWIQTDSGTTSAGWERRRIGPPPRPRPDE